MRIFKQYLKGKMIQVVGYRRVYMFINIKNTLWNELVSLKNRFFSFLFRTTGRNRGDRVFLIARDISPEQLDDIKTRLSFYAPHLRPHSDLIVQSKISLTSLWSVEPILTFGDEEIVPKFWKLIRPGIFNVDYRRNPADGRAWCEFARFWSKKSYDHSLVRERFQKYVDKLNALKFRAVYIFGTGTSLKNAHERDWSDGYRIVCNTIVRDPKLWKHINPHFVAAGDPIYHFGHTAFPRAFRQDLARRLDETETFFIYPEIFHTIVYREFSSFASRLLPVPQGFYQLIHYNMYENFVLPNLGNVLNLLLLPLACTLSKIVYLWGFDGRAPNDKLFWSNSSLHSYPEFIPELQEAHPAFFNHFVPSDNPDKYVKQVHGDALDDMLSAAENDGWSFVMMHKSWTLTLQKRCHNIDINVLKSGVG